MASQESKSPAAATDPVPAAEPTPVPAQEPAPVRALPRALTMRQKVAYIATFIAGLLFTSPSLMYISIACAAILLLQSRNKKVAILGLVLVAVQIVIVSVFIELMINAARGVP